MNTINVSAGYFLSLSLHTTDVFVGETFKFRCGDREGYWRLNGDPIGQMEPMASFSGTATTDLEGSISCTNANGTVPFSVAALRVFGECLHTHIHELTQKYVTNCLTV